MSSHKNHALRDIRHLSGQVFRSLIALLLLIGTIERGFLFGSLGIWLRIIFGSVVLLYLPGYRITEAAWQDEKLDMLEHSALSLAFSLSVMPLLVFYANLCGFAINQTLIVLLVIAIICLCIGSIVWRK